MTTEKASDIHPDVLNLAQQIADKTNEMIEQVESLDAQKWFPIANDIEQLNNQLQNLLLPGREHPREEIEKTEETEAGRKRNR